MAMASMNDNANPRAYGSDPTGRAPISRDPTGAGRARLVWGGSLAVVLAAHALALPWLMARSTQEAPPPPPALQIDLPPPPAPPQPEPPKPEPPKPEPPKPTPKPTPPKPVAMKLPPPPPVALPPEPAPVATPQPEPPPSPAVQTAVPAPPPPAPPAPASKGPDTYEGRLMAQLYRFKRYPAQARQRHQTGTALLRFTIDRSGHVLAASLERGSGSALLDEETLALVRRADPLPPMPDDRPGPSLELVVPVEFSLN
ncbi:energy transducer TonB [Azospirillum sp. B4]|uniref:energy transducer TonB n=1 Tax=Azospirillum sp. B4 TaxID=95605 RepID=UPI0003460E2E|nr:energy transducer TonB [Azospirillum sp. B4]